MWSDIIIIVADDISPSLFVQLKENDGKKIVKWKIKDILGTNVDKRRNSLEKIKKKVENLLKQLEKNS